MLLAGCGGTTRETAHPAAAQTRLQLGLEYLARNQLDAAHRNLNKAVSLAPEDYRTQLGMALYEQRIGENEAAERRYQRALGQAPGNGSVLNGYGAFLCGQGRYEAAQRRFDEAVGLKDRRQKADALENAGRCFFRAGRPQEARDRLSRALDLAPAKGGGWLAEAGRLIDAGNAGKAHLLLDAYRRALPASAGSLWLQIRFAALAGHDDEVERYGRVLAHRFPQSEQYQQFLANEY